jgi:hypothetical protein
MLAGTIIAVSANSGLRKLGVPASKPLYMKLSEGDAHIMGEEMEVGKTYHFNGNCDITLVSCRGCNIETDSEEFIELEEPDFRCRDINRRLGSIFKNHYRKMQRHLKVWPDLHFYFYFNFCFYFYFWGHRDWFITRNKFCIGIDCEQIR